MDKKVNCEYLTHANQCASVLENDEARTARKAECENENETTCCYLCDYQKRCEISCEYLGGTQRLELNGKTVGACTLLEGEELVFDDGNLGHNKRLVLTNKRLVFLKGKGTFNKTYQEEDELSINDVESARHDTKSGAIVLQLKNGDKDIIDFVQSVGFEDAFMGTDPDIIDVKLQATIDRWVNEINRLAVKVLKMVYCKYCGARNKSTDMKCVHCGALLT